MTTNYIPIEITSENYDFYEDLIQTGYEALEGNADSAEVFHTYCICDKQLKPYVRTGDEQLVRSIENALNEYDDEMDKLEEEKEENIDWAYEDWVNFREQEMVESGYGWD